MCQNLSSFYLGQTVTVTHVLIHNLGNSQLIHTNGLLSQHKMFKVHRGELNS